MVLEIPINQTVIPSLTNHSWNTFFTTIKPLVALILGIAIYSFFIFKFYRFLATRDLLKQHWHRKYVWADSLGRRIIKTLFYILEYLLLEPLIVFFWFIILAGSLLFLSTNSLNQILLISMGIIGAIRITAYYNEDLSRDISKIIPFTLLGVYVVDTAVLSFQNIFKNAFGFLYLFDKFLFFLLFIVVIEFILRILRVIYEAMKKEDEDISKISDEE